MPERMHVSAPASAANLGPGFDCLAVALELRNEVTIGPGDGRRRRGDGRGRGRPRGASRGRDNLFVRAFSSPPAPIRAGCGSRCETASRSTAAWGRAPRRSRPASSRAWHGRAGTTDPLPAAVELEGHPDNVAAALLGGLTLAWNRGRRPGRSPPHGRLPGRLRRRRARRRAPDQARAGGAARDDRPRRRRVYDRAGRAARGRARVGPGRAPDRCARRPPARAVPGAVRAAPRRCPGPARRLPGLRRDDLGRRAVGARVVRARARRTPSPTRSPGSRRAILPLAVADAGVVVG